MIKLRCIKKYYGIFNEGEEYKLLQRRGGGFVETIRHSFIEVINNITGHTHNFVINADHETINYYDSLEFYFDLVPQNKRLIFFEKINNTCEIKL